MRWSVHPVGLPARSAASSAPRGLLARSSCSTESAFDRISPKPASRAGSSRTDARCPRSFPVRIGDCRIGSGSMSRPMPHRSPGCGSSKQTSGVTRAYQWYPIRAMRSILRGSILPSVSTDSLTWMRWTRRSMMLPLPPSSRKSSMFWIKRHSIANGDSPTYGTLTVSAGTFVSPDLMNSSVPAGYSAAAMFI